MKRIVIFSVLMAFLSLVMVNGLYAKDTIKIEINKKQATLWGTVAMAGSGFMLWSSTGLTYPLVAGCIFTYSIVKQIRGTKTNEKVTTDSDIRADNQ